MSGPKGKVQRMDWANDLPKIVHRTRDIHALFSQAQWGWSADPAEAWVFDTYDAGGTPETDAAAHVAAMRDDERQHCIPVVVSLSPDLEAERTRRHNDRLANIELPAGRSITPSDTYRATAARLGEHE